MSKRATLQDVANGDVVLLPEGEWIDSYYEADYIEEEESLPRIQLRWAELVIIYLNDEDLQHVLEAYPNTKATKNSAGEDGYHIWGVKAKDGKVVTHHETICNFRRYGWCCTRDPEGKYGYSGVTYANCEAIGPIPQTPQQVVRESLVAQIAKMRAPEQLRYSMFLWPLWNKLVEDALANMTEFAHRAAGQHNGTVSKVRVNGEQKSWRAEREKKEREAQLAVKANWDREDWDKAEKEVRERKLHA